MSTTRGTSSAVFFGLGTLVVLFYFAYFVYISFVFSAAAASGSIRGDRPLNVVDSWVLVFLGSILVEVVLCVLFRLAPAATYRTTDAISSISSGLFDILLTKQVSRLIAFNLYVWVYERAALFRLADSSAWFLFLLMAHDFSYYWVHRFGHTMAFYWAAHSVHHSSESYNLSTALRQSFVHQYSSALFYLPLAVIGFSPQMLVCVNSVNLVYQYWVHTPLVPKLPRAIEFVFCTPSQHRVHHARNPRYVDKNYGGILVLWDRLFGTFEEERDDDVPVYGVIGPINSFSPIWIQLQPFVAMFSKMSLRRYSLADNLRVLFERPGWLVGSRAQYQPLPPVDRVQYYMPALPATVQLYLALHFVPALLLYGFTALFTGANPFLFICVTIFNIGGLSDRRPWAVYSELLRLASLPFLAKWYLHAALYSWWVTALATLLSFGVILHNWKHLTESVKMSELGLNVQGMATQHLHY